MPTIFVNYRIREQAGYAALLDRALRDRFGADAVFRDFRSVRPGDDFVHEILRSLRSCTVLLAVIGPGWRAKVNGDRWDWVHREIAEAFMQGVRVIPVLVEDADLPRPEDLPADIAALSRCQAVRLRHGSVESDLEYIVQVVGRLLTPRPARSGYVLPGSAHGEHVKVFQLHGSSCRIGVVSGSIRRVRFADVWVNPENTEMEMARVTEFSVSAIIRYGGARLDAAGRMVEDVIADELAGAVGGRRPVAPNTAVITGAGRLTETHNVRHVIHVACVQGEPGAGFRQVRNVGECVTNTLGQADALAVTSILIPLLGVGVGGGPVQPTVRGMLVAATDYLTATTGTALRTVYFLAYTDVEYAAFIAAIDACRALSAVEVAVQSWRA